jgi:hypothetical protein
MISSCSQLSDKRRDDGQAETEKETREWNFRLPGTGTEIDTVATRVR